MDKVNVELRGEFDNSYEISVDYSVMDELVADLKARKYGHTPVVICDENTRELFGHTLVEKLALEDVDPLMLTVPAGENSKSLDVFGSLLEAMLEAGITRQDVVVALGGGVVGDLSGYVAGSYMRGINFVQVPTTLLSQVDSSVGGKVAVNIKHWKNYCGMFYQPKRVYTNISALESLPEREILSGLGEVVKTAFIADRDLVDYLSANAEKVRSLDSEVMAKVVARCCEIKADVVIRDEKEGGVRRILNYGHTVGHAIETFAGYEISHGECVAWGMRIVARACHKGGMLSAEDLKLHEELMDKLGLATGKLDIEPAKIMQLMQKDKKVKQGAVVIVGLDRLGNAVVCEDFSLELIEAELEKMA
ncbi:3-dehydroquinate synthase [Desulfovibrio sp. JC022]|uniref:3-dehydroquinate synthase n=1 Tax=Desulfovibrio sp. JC022 TaxID=2593642 RepID=UPI0013D42066|nr:3-dehydroquinate synthase [Desulfovibrio sp. JC022]NDV21256.1 3-dehydroquinate synthase [Desulfovibrio sp. JC022]